MSATTSVSKTLKTVAKGQKALAEQLEKLGKPVYTQGKPGNVLGSKGPNVRKGENALTSRGYSFLKLAGVLGGIVSKEDAKVEIQLSNKLNQYYDSLGYVKAEPNSIMAPLGSEFIAQEAGGAEFAREVEEVTKAGVSGSMDPQQFLYMARRYGTPEMVQKALSWIDESQGGALVGPPMMGELIEVLRNNEALMAAGCRTIAMPPNGRITFPRQTAAGTAYFVGESTTVTDSTPQTGDLILQAKKLAVLIKVPNELFRFASVSVEQFIREDIARVAALRLDKELLEGPGSSVAPKGLINYANISKMTAGSPGVNGDTLIPEDVAKMVGTVEEQNAVFRALIMRPLMYTAIANRRADAAVAGDKAGPFVFSLFRDINYKDIKFDRARLGALYEYPVVKTTQMSQARAKGSASNLTYIIGGDFTDYIIALGGVIEFQVSTQGDTPFSTDQTWLRGIQYVDGGPRHEASFVLVDNLIVG